MIQFILNDKKVSTQLQEGSTVLDFIRYEKRLTGTKIGCREGDCGACTVLVGQLENDKLSYISMTSCLMPLVNAHGKHIVTVEGINMENLSPVQKAMVDTNGTQCGFCTLGFVMSFTGFVLHNQDKSYQKAIEHIDGNICRCTGYKSIERAAAIISEGLKEKPESETLHWLVSQGFLPDYFLGISTRLRDFENRAVLDHKSSKFAEYQMLTIGGGTDLMVQKHHEVKKSSLSDLLFQKSLKSIEKREGKIWMGASVTVSQFAESPEIQAIFPDLKKHIKLVSSTPIRNMATLAGNLVNASPIGDMTVFLLALDAEIELTGPQGSRQMYLREFYKGYKTLEKSKEEIISKVIFSIPSKGSHFNFEKVCKRQYLDIASVNSGFLISLGQAETIDEIHISAGGVFAFPMYLAKTVAFLKGKKLETEVLEQALEIIQSEIAPISDARGTADYKRLLLRQLVFAHFEPFVKENQLKSLMKLA